MPRAEIFYQVTFAHQGKESPINFGLIDNRFRMPMQAWLAAEKELNSPRKQLREAGFRVRKIAEVSDEAAIQRVDQLVRESQVSGSKASRFRQMLNWIRPSRKD
jgi:hypothetical protein